MNWLRRWYEVRPAECALVVWTAGMAMLAAVLTAVTLIFG